ncbi:MAG: nucleotidyltransferase family protein, partial [Prevotella sp.]
VDKQTNIRGTNCLPDSNKQLYICLSHRIFSVSFAISQKIPIFVTSKRFNMKTTQEYISLIGSHAEELKTMFGIRSLRIFGSVSRNEHKEGSDVDVCVDMEPKAFLVVRLKRFLENLLQCSVDVVRMHKHINPYLLEEINKDGIYVIQ